ncbi:nucleotidyltransferase domain-containing protein [Elusimicrobiota bacterium]
MHNIFSTKQRIKILKSIIYETDSVSVNNTASKTKLSKGLVSKYFEILINADILKKTNGKLNVTDNSITKGVKILLNLDDIDNKIFRKKSFVESVGLYGSCAKGENNIDSDIDIWVRVRETNEEDLASLSSAINKKIKNGKILYLTEDKIRKMQKNDKLFYHSLVFGSIIIFGDSNGIQI